MNMRKSLFTSVLVFFVTTTTVPAADYKKVDLLPEQMIMPTAWVQTSAEYRALTITIYRMAKVILDMHLATPSDKPKAVVLDLDETVLDNSPYQAMSVEYQTGYPNGWFDWVDAGQAEATPGALDFLHYADQQGVQIFYLSNRKIKKDRLVPGMENTLRNLRALGAPQAEESHMYLRSGSSSKEKRRQAIAENHEVVMWFGDNLNDHSDDFKGKTIAERKAAVDQHQDKFGTSFIVLPNPMYGEWEGAVYDYNWGASSAEKTQMRKQSLNTWHP